MNVLTDQQGIINRYFREQSGWDEHLINTKNFILSSAQNRKKNSVLLLGSGWLLDIPIDELCHQFEKVYLLDINHPAQVKQKIKRFSNVILIEKDITGGGLIHAHNIVRAYKKDKRKVPIKSFKNLKFSLNLSYDFIVSVNILNQLDILIVDYLKQYKIYTNGEIIELKKIIQQQHINLLPKDKSCLIADVEEKLYDKNNNYIKSNTTVHINLPKSAYSAIWEWKFDSTMNYYPKMKTYFKVMAISI